MHRFTRQELYDLVWSVPISTLAVKYGLSDRGLAKVCERHQIPVPSRGHWARIEAGQKVTQTPLWKTADPAIQQVTFGWQQHRHPEAAFAFEATRKAKEAQKVGTTATTSKVKIRDIGKSPHHSLVSFSNELRRAPIDHEGGIRMSWLHIHRDNIPRVLTLLNTLAHELESAGIICSLSGKQMWFVQGASNIHFEIRSPKKRIEGRPGSWRSFENVFVGRLSFQIYGPAEGIKKSWVDKDGVEIESDLANIVTSVQISLTVQAQIDEQRQKAEERRAFHSHRKDLEAKRAEREKMRAAYLDDVARDRREVLHLTETVSLLPLGVESSPEVARMIEWAKARIASLEERTSPGSIQRALEDQQLFPEPDHLADPGEYPEDEPSLADRPR